jgi:hypothetical protein
MAFFDRFRRGKTSQPGSGNDDMPEEKLVEQWVKRLDRARAHDKPARGKYAIDRRWAAGTMDIDRAVATNLIGTYIDILVDYLYAKDPDVSVQPAEEVQSAMPQLLQEPDPEALVLGDPEAIAQADARIAQANQELALRVKRAQRADFAATLQIVISRLWKRGKLKRNVKKQVRSCLSVGPGWIKVIMLSDELVKNPEVQQKLNDLRDNLKRVQAGQKRIAEGNVDDPILAQQELEEQIAGLEPTLEIVVKKTLAIDFVSAEDIQISTDVRYIDDYVDAGWCANRIFMPKDELPERFPRLEDDDCSQATCYVMRSPKEAIKPTDGFAADLDETMGIEDSEAADQYVTAVEAGYSTSAAGTIGSDTVEEFVAVWEIWDRRANNIKTRVEGVKRWAKEPFPPTYPTERFYPYFYLAFYEVDNARHSQSMSGRLAKLQDEFNSVRSGYRLTRHRSTPGVLFNSGAMGPEEARKVTESEEQELTGIKPTNPNAKLSDLFAAKPVAQVDPMIYDTTAIVRDMEKISGVQEAQQSSAVRRPNMTATEAEIEQSGFAARVQADQDTLDDMLSELAQYTAELALGCLTEQDVVKIAGSQAWWPENLPIEDLTSLVEVDIEAGSTGKPNRQAEQKAWSTMLPMIRQDIIEIQQARMMGNEPLAKALTELLRETLKRLGDRADIARFIPDPVPIPPGTMGPEGEGGPPGSGEEAGGGPPANEPGRIEARRPITQEAA